MQAATFPQGAGGCLCFSICFCDKEITVIRIRMRYRKAIWTQLGREVLYVTTYSDGLEVPEWYVVHDHNQNPFTFYARRKA